MKKENPYKSILDTMEEQGSLNNPPALQFGIVKSVSPLQIACGDLPLNPDNLKISRSLKERIEEIEASTNTVDEHSHSINSVKHKFQLNINDTVLLYEIVKNKLYVIIEVIEDV
ncbi:DUF2577 family protein [uncultured Clostridium sp.]|uniref:DUF2577 family protein n=1 Tax=uncultured Clostridium sp. TaxID=59620 RepID=UPI0025ECAE55|nr:DUF2577 family protein [uncultured Clostridium sp.]